MGMILDDARAAVLLAGGAAGVAKRLALCADILEQRKRQKMPFDSDKMRAQAETIVARRVAAIRAQLLPSWGEGRAAAMADELLVPSLAAPRIEALLADVESATQGKKTAAALVAQDLIRMVRMVERSELDLGLTNVVNGRVWSAANDRIDALLPPPEDASTPDFMKGHTIARDMVHEWIDAWRPSSQFLQLLDSVANPDTITMANVNPELYKELKALELKASAAHKLVQDAAMNSGGFSEEARKAAQDFYDLRVKEAKAIYEKYHQVREQLLQQRNQAWKVFEPGSPMNDAAQACIQEVVQSSPVDEKQADTWARDQVITPAAKSRLRKMGYAPEQVVKDMAEFYRFTRGRVEKLRIDTKGDKRANTVGVGAHGQPGVIWIDGDFDKRTLWHEMGHHIEADPAAAAAARLFIRMRADSPEPKKLRELTGSRGYRSDEIAFADHFFSPYVGKIYAHGTTEVFSMGLETFSNPSLLAQRMKTDPQTLQFVMGYIHSPQDTLQALHLAMRQSLRQANEDAKEAAEEVSAAKYKALAAQARPKFTADTSMHWAGAHGVGYSASQGNAKQVGYLVDSGRQIYIAQASVRNPATKRRMVGYRLMMVFESSRRNSDGSPLFGLRYNDYPTKDFDLVLAAALLFAQTGDSPWFDNVLEGKF